MDLLYSVFEPVDANWRGLGVIPGSGLGFGEDFSRFNALLEFDLSAVETGDEPRVAGQTGIRHRLHAVH